MRSYPSWNPEGRGCRGGRGPTAGQRARRFTFTFPDGKAGSKSSFRLSGPGPFVALCSPAGYDDTVRRGGSRELTDEPRVVWRCDGVFRAEALPDWVEGLPIVRDGDLVSHALVPAEEVQ